MAHHEHFHRQNTALKRMYKSTRYSIFSMSAIVENKLLSSGFQYDTNM